MIRTACVAAALLVGWGATAAAAPAPAIVRLAARSPITVSGTGFRPGERVHLLVSAGRSATESVTANGNGAFRERFAFSAGRCARVFVFAVGSRGTVARYATRLAVDCIRKD